MAGRGASSSADPAGDGPQTASASIAQSKGDYDDRVDRYKEDGGDDEESEPERIREGPSSTWCCHRCTKWSSDEYGHIFSECIHCGATEYDEFPSRKARTPIRMRHLHLEIETACKVCNMPLLVAEQVCIRCEPEKSGLVICTGCRIQLTSTPAGATTSTMTTTRMIRSKSSASEYTQAQNYVRKLLYNSLVTNLSGPG